MPRPLPTTGFTNNIASAVMPSTDMSAQIRHETAEDQQFINMKKRDIEMFEANVTNELAKFKPLQFWDDTQKTLQTKQSKLVEQAHDKAVSILKSKKGLGNASDLANIRAEMQNILTWQNSVKTVEDQAKAQIKNAEKRKELYDPNKSRAKIMASYRKWIDNPNSTPDFTPVIKGISDAEIIDNLTKNIKGLSTRKDETKSINENSGVAGIAKTETTGSTVTALFTDDNGNPDSNNIKQYLGSIYDNDARIRSKYLRMANDAFKSNTEKVTKMLKNAYRDDYDEGEKLSLLSKVLFVNDEKFQNALINKSTENKQGFINLPKDGSSGGGATNKNLFSGNVKVGKTALSYMEGYTDKKTKQVKFNQKYSGSIPIQDIYLGENSTLQSIGITNGNIPGDVVGSEEIDGKIYYQFAIKPSGNKDFVTFSASKNKFKGSIEASLNKIGNVITIGDGSSIRFDKGTILLISPDNVSNAKLNDDLLPNVKQLFSTIDNTSNKTKKQESKGSGESSSKGQGDDESMGDFFNK